MDVWEDSKIVNVIWGRFLKYLENFYKRNLTWIFLFWLCLSLPSLSPSDISTNVTFLVFIFRFLSFQSLLKFHLLSMRFHVGFSYLKLWFSTHLTINSTSPYIFLILFFSIFHHMNKSIFYLLIKLLSVSSNWHINSMKAGICFVLFCFVFTAIALALEWHLDLIGTQQIFIEYISN